MNSEFMIPYQYDEVMESRKWTDEIPFIQFPSDWQIKIVPPFAGAVIRFLIKKSAAQVSIYLDCYGKLGCMNEPYWEVYPADNGDTFRCYLNEIDLLLDAIQKSLTQQNEYMNWELNEEYRKDFIDISWVEKSEGEIKRVRFVQYPNITNKNNVHVFYSKIQDTGELMSEVASTRSEKEGNVWEIVDSFEAELALEDAAKKYNISIDEIKTILNQRGFKL